MRSSQGSPKSPVKSPLAAAAASVVKGGPKLPTAKVSLADEAKLAASMGMTPAQLYAAREAAKVAQERAAREAKMRYAKRYVVLGEFYWDVIRHSQWKQSLREAIEITSGFATVSENAETSGLVSLGALNTAFWSAMRVPTRIPVGFVDDKLRQVFEHFDQHDEEKIDYRELLQAISLFQIGVRDPIARLVRAWYRAYDSDAHGGIFVQQFRKMMLGLCLVEEERWTVTRLVEEGMRDLLKRAAEYKLTTKSLPDKVAAYANAIRLSKRLGASYLKASVTAGDEVPSFITPVWSPYDVALSRKEKFQAVIHADVITAWLDDHKELKVELQRERRNATHPEFRAEMEREENEKKLAEMMNKREEKLGRRAALHRRVVVTTKVVAAWTRYITLKHVFRGLLREAMQRRVVGVWRRYTKNNQILRTKMQKAHAFWVSRFVKKKFAIWTVYSQVEGDKRKVAWARATSFHGQQVCEKAFAAWKTDHFARKSKKYNRWYLLRLTFANWAGFTTNADIACIRPWEEATRVRQSTVTVSIDGLKEQIAQELALAAAREEAQQHAEAYQEFVKKAAEEEERVRWEQMREAAKKKIHNRRLLQQQETERREAHAEKRRRKTAAFDEKWQKTIDAAMRERKERALAFIKDKKQKAMLEAEGQKIMLAKDLQAVTQDYSIFKVKVSMEDGCMHFTRERTPEEMALGMLSIDINIDSMNSKEGMLIGADYYASRLACEVRNKIQDQKADEWTGIQRNEAATTIQMMYKQRKWYIKTFSALRAELELLSDPFTGSLYLQDVARDWVYRVIYSPEGVPTYWYERPAIPETHYASILDVKRKKKAQETLASLRESGVGHHMLQFKRAELEMETKLTSAPPGYLLCQICGFDFARRECSGEGCGGCKYCWACFTSYHPRDSPEWLLHWEPMVSRVLYVKPENGRPTAEEKRLMDGWEPKLKTMVTGIDLGDEDSGAEKEVTHASLGLASSNARSLSREKSLRTISSLNASIRKQALSRQGTMKRLGSRDSMSQGGNKPTETQASLDSMERPESREAPSPGGLPRADSKASLSLKRAESKSSMGPGPLHRADSKSSMGPGTLHRADSKMSLGSESSHRMDTKRSVTPPPSR